MKRSFPWLLRATLSLLLLGGILWHIDTGPVLSALGQATPWYLYAAAVLLLPNVMLQYSKWRLLLRAGAPAVLGGDARASLFAGFTLGLLTPARLGEFGGRAVLCRGAGKGLLMGLTAVDKAGTMLVTVVFGLVAVMHLSTRSDVLPTVPVVLAGLLVLVLLLTALFLFVGPVSSLPRRWLDEHDGRLSLRIRHILETLRAMPRGTVTKLLAYSLLFYLTFLLQFLLLLAAFGPLRPIDALSGVAAIMFVKTVVPPVTIGELGIREGASVLILSVFGVASAAAFSASILLFTINILLPAVAGSWFLLRSRVVGIRPS